MELGTRSRRRSPEPGPGRGADYLSALPDDLLLLVLARLGCAAAAARTGLLARRWRGLWARLRDLAFRDVAFPSLQVALGRVAVPPPAVSLLEIRVPGKIRPAADAVTSLLRAAARLAPEKLVFGLTGHLPLQDPNPAGVDLPCFHRATSIVLEWIPFVLRAPAAGGEFPALLKLSLTGCKVDDLGTLLSLCPRLRVLRLKSLIWLGGDDLTTVHSASLQELVMESIWTHRVDIVAPILKQLTLSSWAEAQVSISILAPMIQNVSWQWLYDNGTIGFGLWTLEKLRLQTAQRQGQLPSLLIHASSSWYSFTDEAANFAQEIEKHMVTDFFALELHLRTTGHVFGEFVLHFLGLNRIRSVIRRLKVVRVRQGSWGDEACPANCPCDTMNWRTQTISLTALEDLEINGFEAEDHELDFLKLILHSAPMLKTVIVKLSDEISSSDDTITKKCNIFRAYPSVKCNVYLSSGLMHQSQNCLLT
ncbi:hypothetical protein CFC21_111135 [Triticum aestivum]|nr:uncharacterized protein LOC109753665 [Aegilops tauschii subsp. strangulata]XP_044442259.1 uncharacterized protein LOC123168438 [Triticum aestivum]KAF7111085.1 hypothetical protein CFC21_111135 [Triticum aestivum]